MHKAGKPFPGTDNPISLSIYVGIPALAYSVFFVTSNIVLSITNGSNATWALHHQEGCDVHSLSHGFITPSSCRTLMISRCCRILHHRRGQNWRGIGRWALLGPGVSQNGRWRKPTCNGACCRARDACCRRLCGYTWFRAYGGYYRSYCNGARNLWQSAARGRWSCPTFAGVQCDTKAFRLSEIRISVNIVFGICSWARGEIAAALPRYQIVGIYGEAWVWRFAIVALNLCRWRAFGS